MKLLSLDSETTGVDTRLDVPVEVAWVEIDEDFNVLSEFESLVNPHRSIPLEASEVNGIYDHHLEGAPELHDLPWPDEDVVLIGHNIMFDWYMIGQNQNVNVVEQFCTMRMARRLWPTSTPNHKLQTLVEIFDLPVRGRAHTSLADVYSVIELVKYMSRWTGKSLNQMREELEVPHIFSLCPIGKFKGREFKDIPKAYLDWILSADFDPDIRASALRALGRK